MLLPNKKNSGIGRGRLGPFSMGSPTDGGGSADRFVPHLKDFWTNDKGLTEYETTFNITGPNVVLEMGFLYEGDPIFTITHGNDTFSFVASERREQLGIGCLVAVASGVVTEIATLKVTATGGTFGGIFGRVRELSFKPYPAWTSKLNGTDKNHHYFTSPVAGELVGVSMWKGGYIDTGKFTGIDKQVNVWILDGVEIPYTIAPIGEPWVEVSPGVYDIDTPFNQRPRLLTTFTFDEPASSPIYWDFGATVAPGSITFSGIGDVTTNNNWVTGDVVGANVTQEQSRYNSVYTGGRVEGYGTCRVGNFKFYNQVENYGFSVYRSPDVSEASFRCFYGDGWAMLLVSLVDADGWLPFTMTAGDTGSWAGYTSGDLASPPFNPPMGLISNQPYGASALQAMYVDPADSKLKAIFSGDISASVEGLGVQVDDYIGTASDISLFAGSTVIVFEPSAPLMVDGKTYGVVFTPGGA